MLRGSEKRCAMPAPLFCPRDGVVSLVEGVHDFWF